MNIAGDLEDLKKNLDKYKASTKGGGEFDDVDIHNWTGWRTTGRSRPSSSTNLPCEDVEDGQCSTLACARDLACARAHARARARALGPLCCHIKCSAALRRK